MTEDVIDTNGFPVAATGRLRIRHGCNHRLVSMARAAACRLQGGVTEVEGPRHKGPWSPVPGRAAEWYRHQEYPSI
jgi:hypothetical protein